MPKKAQDYGCPCLLYCDSLSDAVSRNWAGTLLDSTKAALALHLQILGADFPTAVCSPSDDLALRKNNVIVLMYILDVFCTQWVVQSFWELKCHSAWSLPGHTRRALAFWELSGQRPVSSQCRTGLSRGVEFGVKHSLNFCVPALSIATMVLVLQQYLERLYPLYPLSCLLHAPSLFCLVSLGSCYVAQNRSCLLLANSHSEKLFVKITYVLNVYACAMIATPLGMSRVQKGRVWC